MPYQVFIATGLLIFVFNLVLNLRSLRRPLTDGAIDEPAPLISVLIPARDEEVNIGNCLECLQKQDYPNFEILVLDDGSLDNTVNIVQQIAANDSRIQLLRGEPLPEGWAGKPFACHQLAKIARGSWLLFIDADTTHAPHMLRSVLALATRLKPALLSGFPRQLTTSLPQKVAIPVIYFIIMSWLPLWWFQRSKNPKPSLAIGQFMLFPTEEYWRIGGHESVKSRIVEDIWLGAEVCRHGGRHMAIDLSPVVSCNMYRSLGAMWEGLVRSLYSIAAISPVGFVGMFVAGYIFFLAPFYSLWNVLALAAAPTDLRGVVYFQVVAIVIMRWLVGNRFKESLISTLLHPFGFSFLYLAALYAGVRRASGGRVRWKKRLYSKESCVVVEEICEAEPTAEVEPQVQLKM
jgi:chlorobactene glucosyltransferase